MYSALKECGKIPGDPAALAGVSEHSQQVALMAAVAQYACAPNWDGCWERIRNEFQYEELASVEIEKVRQALNWLHAIPNGGGRGNDKRSAMIQGANMKAEGQKRGVSDLCLNVARQGYRCFYIEMKKPGEGRWVKKRGLANGNEQLAGVGMGEKVWESGESDEQKAFGAWIASEGGLYGVFYSWYSALRAIMWYLGFSHSKEWELPE